MRRKVATLLCGLALACAGFGAALAHDGHSQPGADQGAAEPEAPPNRWGAGYFPNVELVTQDGRKVRLYDDLLKGKSVAINVIFTDCKDVCPLETAMMVRLHELLGARMGRDIWFYSVSIDPERDTPAVLKAYAEKYGAPPRGWLFLTGKAQDIRIVTRKLGLLRARDKNIRDGHGSLLLVGNEPSGQWQRNSALDEPNFLAARMAGFLGWKESAPGKSYADARPLDFDAGQYLFQSRCSACHSIGEGDKIGPDLRNVSARRDHAWLARYVRVPDEVLAAGDPTATALYKKYKEVRMPNLRLAPDEVRAVLSYIDARSKSPRH